MKIKRKVEMNLPQLIEHIEKTKYKPARYKSDSSAAAVFVTHLCGISFNQVMYPNVKFTVEVEEEITEDTVIPKLVTKNINGDYNEWTDRSFSDFVLAHMEAIYILNDCTMTLIWRNGKMVE